MLSDSGWMLAAESNTRRGYHVYERFVNVGRPLDENETADLYNSIVDKDKFKYFSVIMTKHSAGIYRFVYTIDSSD